MMEAIVDDYVLEKRSPIKVGILGLGRATLLEHIPELKKMDGMFKLTAVCDLQKERRDIVEAEFPQVRRYRRLEDMLGDQEIDLVDISTFSIDHVDHVTEVLQRGKWVVVESPMATLHDDALFLKAADLRAKGRLFVRQMGAFAPDFLAAMKVLDDVRLGEVYSIKIRKQCYARRDDWQSVHRCGGGALLYACVDMIYQALALLRMPPTHLWSDVKRIASLGDAEDYAHIILKTRGPATVDIQYTGAEFSPDAPSFEIRGERGVFRIMPGARVGTLHAVEENYKFQRRRASVRTPPIHEEPEKIPLVDYKIECDAPETGTGGQAFWNAVYRTIRKSLPFPISLDESIEPIRIIDLVKKASPISK